MAESTHDPGPWRDGNTADSIVADLPEGAEPDDNSQFYGGLVVAESVSAKNKPLIKAAPDLLDYLLGEERLQHEIGECDFCFDGDGPCSGDEDGNPNNHFAETLALDELRRDLIARAAGFDGACKTCRQPFLFEESRRGGTADWKDYHAPSCEPEPLPDLR